jgi:hypothetical protein
MENDTVGEIPSRRGSKRRNNHRPSRMKEKLRIISNIGLIVGQCVLLFSSRDVGLAIIICSSLLSVPFFLKERMWDVLLLITFMQFINFIGLLVK